MRKGLGVKLSARVLAQHVCARARLHTPHRKKKETDTDEVISHQ
jgi:hypothetical protein